MKRAYIGLFLLFALVCCNRQNAEIASSLHRAERAMHDRPDEALKTLEAIDRSKIRSRSSLAEYALLYAQALDKNYVDATHDSLTRIAVEYYDDHGPDDRIATAHYYHGRVYANAGNTDLAIQSFAIAENAARKTKDYYLLGLINNAISNLYYAQYELEEALLRDQKAEEYFHKAGASYNEALSIVGQGVIYGLKNDKNMMIAKHNDAIRIYHEAGAIHKILPLYESIAATQLEDNRDIRTIKYELNEYYKKYNHGKPPLQSLGLWLAIYLKEQNLDSARICGQAILDHRDQFSAHKVAGCCAQMEQIEYSRSNYRQAYRYAKEYIAIVDSLARAKEQQLILELEQKYRNEILHQSYENLQIHHRHQKIILVLVVLLAAITIASILVFFFRWRRRTADKIRQAEAEIRNLNTTYRELQAQLETVGSRVDTGDAHERKLYEALEERLLAMRSMVEKAVGMKPAEFLRRFREAMTENTKSRNGLSDLQYVVNKKYCGIIDYLKIHYPGLSKQDLDLCSLLCFGFSQHGICFLYDYDDIGSFYNKRSRLRQKLGIPQDSSIEEFIEELLGQLRKKQFGLTICN